MPLISLIALTAWPFSYRILRSFLTTSKEPHYVKTPGNDYYRVLDSHPFPKPNGERPRIQTPNIFEAQSYQATRDSRGQLTAIKSEADNEVSLEYDASGNTAAFSLGKSGRFVIESDAAGQGTSRRLPSGATYRYEYDSRGRVTKQSDGRGRSVTFERDASGASTGVVTASGDWVRAARDQAGRIVSLKTSSGKSRYFMYDVRGALTTYTDARQTQALRLLQTWSLKIRRGGGWEHSYD